MVTLILGAVIGCLVGWFFVSGWLPFHQTDHVACLIEQAIVIENQGEQPVIADSLYVQIPPDNERQRAALVGVTPEELQVSETGGVLTVKGFRALLPGDELRIVYSMIVKTRRTESLRSQEVNPSDTALEADIESSADAIVEEARKLSAGADSAEEKAYRFYEFVAGNIDFNAEMEPGTGRSALECLKRNEGVCGHKANLLTALCRASGIPARTVIGFILPKSEKAAQRGSHAWNEIYIGGQGWFFADPTFGSSVRNRQKYWKQYDLHRIRTAPSAKYDCFAAARERLGDEAAPACEVLAFPRFLLTVQKDSVNERLVVRGDKSTTKATYMDAPW